MELEIAAFTTCGRCPGGNIEYAPEEMMKNGVTHIHFATGFQIGYPPCPYMEHSKRFITEKYGVKVNLGTHPIPQTYYSTHTRLNTWDKEFLLESIQPSVTDEVTRLNYD
jgi:predicted metal-binding protein